MIFAAALSKLSAMQWLTLLEICKDLSPFLHASKTCEVGKTQSQRLYPGSDIWKILVGAGEGRIGLCSCQHFADIYSTGLQPVPPPGLPFANHLVTKDLLATRCPHVPGMALA